MKIKNGEVFDTQSKYLTFGVYSLGTLALYFLVFLYLSITTGAAVFFAVSFVALWFITVYSLYQVFFKDKQTLSDILKEIRNG